jgi:radical SAM superfamily enzyme YgiQ (UPF0313 family)
MTEGTKKSILFVQAAFDLRFQQAWGAHANEVYRRLDIDRETGEVTSHYSCAPLPAATLHALTPDHFEVDTWDENLDGPLGPDSRLAREHYDIVAISVMFSYVLSRVEPLAALFRSRGSFVAAGGPGISATPHKAKGLVDAVFINEAELTWPRFLADWERGEAKSEYVQVEKPDLGASPPPKWDSVADRVTEYHFGTVQTTRGCPFDCEFCDVIYLFGRAQRHKPIPVVLDEVRTLQRLGSKHIFFTDDEFIGNPKYAKSLLRELIPLNNSFPQPLDYYTQLTMNLSKDAELLELVADANFYAVFIGLESFSEESLRETHKLQNIRKDLVADLRRILSYGIPITASMIVGFDHDGPEIFDLLVDGVRRACLPVASVTMLRAFTGTKLWTRMRQENRLAHLDAESLPRSLMLEIMPVGMSRVELLEGWNDTVQKLFEWSFIAERLRGWVSLVEREPRVVEPQPTKDRAIRNLRALREKLGLNADADLRTMEEMLEHTFAVAPFMVNRVFAALFANDYQRRSRSLYTEEQFREVVAAERGGKVVYDDTPLPVPAPFASAYRELFPEVYTRLYRNLPDRTLLADAASEVFVDFLVRWGEGFTGASERHYQFLRELCDRTCAKLSGQPPETFVAVEDGDAVPMAEIRRTRLADSVLKNVVDEMRSIAGDRAEMMVAAS